MAALPNRNIFDGTSNPTTSAMKTALGSLRDYLSGLLGDTGTAADARTALGISATNTPYTASGGIAATNVQAALTELDSEKVTKTSATGSAVVPVGTTGERDGTPSAGYLRFNTSATRAEIYNGTAWGSLGGATGGGTDDAFYENTNVITTNYTLSTNKNAMSAGPISINAGITVTIPAGSVWSII